MRIEFSSARRFLVWTYMLDPAASNFRYIHTEAAYAMVGAHEPLLVGRYAAANHAIIWRVNRLMRQWYYTRVDPALTWYWQRSPSFYDDRSS
jgi:hypothetical protein